MSLLDPLDLEATAPLGARNPRLGLTKKLSSSGQA
jgi:hypothetical protein